jgi:alpha-tubulin suppressor-like RCC1 family protein
VWCWGYNGYGAVSGTGVNIYSPTQVSLPVTALSVYAGADNSCASLADGALMCWGMNSSGQLGIGSSDNNVNGTPSAVLNIPASFIVADLAIGLGHMCAVSTTNIVWCWGGTSSGKLAVTPGSSITTPQALTVGTGSAIRASAGDEHTCIALATTVSCFGDNSFGQLGYTPFNATNATPTPTAMGATVDDVVAGAEFTCARLRNATPKCWGSNSSSQLATGTSSTTPRESPEPVDGLDATVVDIAIAGSHGCALMASGEVRCWGGNVQGQLGVGDRTSRSSATAVSTLNVVPTTTTTTTTTTTLPIDQPIVDLDAQNTTTSSVMTTVVTSPQIIIQKLRLRRGRSVSASKIAKAVSMTIPKASKGKLRISIVGGAKNCAFKNTSIRAVRKGRCTVSVTMVPKKGKKFTRKTTITVT